MLEYKIANLLGGPIMPRVTHFEISADDTARASEFYSKVFGWKINKWDGPMDYILVDTEDGDEKGINGGIVKRQQQAEPTVNTISVNNIDEFATSIMEAGGKIVKPKIVLPGIGYLAYCKDTEGNVFGIMESDENAQE
jgi:predicted enzyme related to lactoylglutathione lyase